MARMSHREYLMIDAWLEAEWNRPSRTDHYLMKICSYLARIPGKGKLRELLLFKIPFGRKSEKGIETQQAKEQRAAQSRAAWRASLNAGERGK